VFVGSPSLMLDALRMGARGSVAALANLRPDLIVELAQAWLDRHDDEAERLQEEIAELERRSKTGPALVSLKRDVAEAMAARGVRYPPALRSPLGT
jgi:dihydrodipicolinate synthase/N-acetylneuraminate lyase